MTTSPTARLAEARALAASNRLRLQDRRQRAISYLRVSVTDRCNYRCRYCMPEDVAHSEPSDICSFEETAALVACFVALGVSRLRLTGGEPTIRKDLPSLVAMLRALPGVDDIALSTNGHLLPSLAEPLRRAGIDRLNVSLDSLDPARFRRLTGRGDLASVLGGLETARSLGFTSIKTNAVVLRGENDGELGDLAAYAWARGFMPRFIEPMPMADGLLYSAGELLPAREIRERLGAAFGATVVPVVEATPKGAGPARYFALEPSRLPRHFGIISPMTEHFCDDCNRVRLSASGRVHACLASDDALDLRAVLRDEGPAAVIARIQAAVSVKRDGHTFDLVGIGGPRKAMVQIGG
jgi:cyclic pyranopterin phosphate synthase